MRAQSGLPSSIQSRNGARLIIYPNNSAVLTFFGKYVGTIKDNGFFWINPLYLKRKISLRASNFDSERVKVNDKRGNPILISVIAVWKVSETYKAAFEVDNYNEFVHVQTDAAVRKLAGMYSYDTFEDDHHEEITLRSDMGEVNETLETDIDQLELIPEFKTRNPQIEAIAMMLLGELQNSQSSSQLYLDSLANIFAVHLLRQYTTKKPQLPIYEGGLPKRQLQKVLDYIDTNLDQNIKLSDLAELLKLSQFHFSRLFKQSIGISPYQYLIKQRIELAKKLLKKTDKFIIDIAFICGFNSHSHLSKKFREFTGMTPKAYRLTID